MKLVIILIQKKLKAFKKRKKIFNKNNLNLEIIMINFMLKYHLYKEYNKLNLYQIVNYNNTKKKRNRS